MTTVSTELVRTLERLDVEYLFGYPGGRAIELLEALAESTIEVVRPRDEREASVMAEMHGRLHRKPGVLTGQGPWIGSIGAIGQLEARLGSSPMVVLTEASERGEYSTLAPYQQARGDYGGFALPKILDGIAKEWWFPRTAKETLRTTQLAFKHATAGRPGPTAVILDGDAVTAEIPETDEPPTLWPPEEQVRNWESRPTESDVERAGEHLATAERSAIIAGNGVHAAGAYDELEAVAERYEAVVTTSYLGKSTIAETHPLAAGVIGSFGHEGANRAVSEADTLLVVGCRLNPMDTNWGAASFVRPDEQTIIHADIDSRNAGWVYPADVGLIGDAKRGLSALDRAAEAYAPGNDWARERARDARESFRVAECDSDAEPIKPQRAVTAIDGIVDENTLVTADSGNNRFWLLNYLQTPARRTYFGSGGVGGMGWGGPAAVSAAITTDRDVVAVAGDGGFAMTMTCVETAVEYGVAPTFVVLNDTGLGMVRQMDDSIPGVEFHDTDFVRVAEGFGAEGTRVRSPANLDETLATAKAADVPTVVDVRIDPDEEMAEKLQSSFYESVGGLHE
ncbi:thiamine pyrophosphate-binding protein [Halococcus dombrowskii]|uniref:Acetolactate synthase large subunit n=1 Tax=Halococcus dombrowskii TaxID=179637 RepID=A0AAV3SJH4_HALDO|nr:thiamine pyrophosphate-binding protein [Halococcus dombrowskii]UOO96357.1 thiamine pyrophosphate-binding protein [Halococcus dombrowskii]